MGHRGSPLRPCSPPKRLLTYGSFVNGCSCSDRPFSNSAKRCRAGGDFGITRARLTCTMVLDDPALNSVAMSSLLVSLARIPKVRRICFLLALKLERGQFYSTTARRILSKYYGVEIGAFSYGSCFRPGFFPPGVTIGRYVSCASDVTILLRNHPIDTLSTHPFFF